MSEPSAQPPASPASEDDDPVLPEQTRDDTDRAWGEDRDGRDDDERYLRERPPHWE